MNIGQVRYFVTVYEEGSFSRAAKKLFVTVQATSKAIADLEREIGGALFERKSRGVEPTPLGAAFYRKAAPVMREFVELETFAQGSGAVPPEGGVLRLALCAPEFNGCKRVLANIAVLLKQRAGVDTSVHLTSRVKGMAELAEGALDALITIGTYESPDTDCIRLLMAPAGVCMLKRHPLADKDPISLADIAPYPVLLVKDAELTEVIYDLHRASGADLATERITTHEQFEDAFVKRDGVMFCVGLPALSDDDIVVHPLARADAAAVPVCLVSMKERKTPALRAAERFLASQAQALL